MKKSQFAKQFIENHLEVLKCPICQSHFTALEANSIICQEKHQFDFAKNGTLYFLNKAIQTEYNQSMLQARRIFLQAGFFEPIITAIAPYISADMQVLDVGCGEGTPIKQLWQLVPATYIGFDIAKAGIQLASDYYPAGWFCTADLTQMPFAKKQFDVILNLFSPSQYQDFKQLLKPQGRLLKVIPNAGYLKELRQLLYHGQAKENYDHTPVVKRFDQMFEDYTVKTITNTFKLNENTLSALLKMTPLTWQAKPEQIQAITLNELPEITLDVTILNAVN